MKTTATTKPTAHETYTKRKAAVRELLKQISAGITKHGRKELKDKRNWGLAGDMGRFEEQLTNIRDCLAGTGEYAL